MRRMLAGGLAIAVVALAGGAFAKSAPFSARRHDKLVCSPPSNGGSLVRGICVLPRASVGQPYEGFIQTSDNSGGTFSVVAGALPPGVSIPRRYGAAGTIVSGTPTERGRFTFTVHGVDQEGQPLRQTYSIKVEPAPPLRFAFPTSCCARGTVGESYLQNLFSNGGVGPYTASVVAGTIPPGLALTTTPPFSISGTPTSAGTFPITIQITDGRGAEAAKRGRIVIRPLGGGRLRPPLGAFPQWAIQDSNLGPLPYQLFAGGKNVKQVQEWLGHADPAFTLRTYVHLVDCRI